MTQGDFVLDVPPEDAFHGRNVTMTPNGLCDAITGKVLDIPIHFFNRTQDGGEQQLNANAYASANANANASANAAYRRVTIDSTHSRRIVK